jgi:hypothetical protein
MTRPMLSPAQCPAHCDTEVDDRCDAASGEPIAVDANALAAGLSAKLVEGFPGTPVHQHGSLATVQRPLAAASLCRHCTPSGHGIRDQLER